MFRVKGVQDLKFWDLGCRVLRLGCRVIEHTPLMAEVLSSLPLPSPRSALKPFYESYIRTIWASCFVSGPICWGRTN